MSSCPLSTTHRKRRRRSMLTALLVATTSSCDAFTSTSVRRLPSCQSNTALYARQRSTRMQSAAVDTTLDPVRQDSSSAQFTPRYQAYEQDKFMGKLQPQEPAIRTANPDTLPSSFEKVQLTEKIAQLLRDSDTLEAFDASEIADKQTVFAKLSDEDLREASDAVAKVTTKKPTENEPIRMAKAKKGAKKARVKASVFETGQDSIKEYMKALGNHQVLSAEDEQVLGRQIQTLAKWEEKRQELEDELLRAPTFAEWAKFVDTTVPELKKQVRRSQKAKAALTEANLRLVVTIARQTVKRNRSEISFQDACQEGIIGLSRACDKFDPEKGFRFSTYAVWWIRKNIHKNVSEQSRPVRLPASAMRKINDIRIHEKVLQDELGRKPRDEEVSAKVGISMEQLEFYRRALDKVISLDSKVKFNKQSDNAFNDPELHQIVKDSSSSPVEMVTKQMLKEDVRRLIGTLSPREQAVIRLRFGLDNGTPATLEDIGRKFKVNAEKIRTIEASALRKLRQPYRNESLKSYMTDL